MKTTNADTPSSKHAIQLTVQKYNTSPVHTISAEHVLMQMDGNKRVFPGAPVQVPPRDLSRLNNGWASHSSESVRIDRYRPAVK